MSSFKNKRPHGTDIDTIEDTIDVPLPDATPGFSVLGTESNAKRARTDADVEADIIFEQVNGIPPLDHAADVVDLDDSFVAGGKGSAKTYSERWVQHIEELKAFRAEFGHCRVSSKDHNWKSLFQWSSHIRFLRKKLNAGHVVSNLTTERIDELDALDFVWEIRSSPSHKAHAVVDEESLPPNAARPPNHVHDAFVDIHENFDDQIEALKTFKVQHGHCGVRFHLDKNLHLWSEKIRQTYKNQQSGVASSSASLSPDQIQRLNEVGFIWSMGRSKSFEERVAELKAYKEKHGHCNIVKQDMQKLYAWTQSIRKAYGERLAGKTPSMELTDDMIAELESIGFEWNLGRANLFAKNLEKLKEFKNQHGDCKVTNTDSSKLLYAWCLKLRKWKDSNDPLERLSAYQIRELDKLGFEWNNTRKSEVFYFDAWFDELKSYAEKHGHCNVTEKDDRRLYSWCYKIRSSYIRGKEGRSSSLVLTEDQIRKLTDIGFDFSAINRDKTFEDRLQELAYFKEEYGHCRVPQKINKSLQTWCARIRRDYSLPPEERTHLDSDKIKRLEDVGFEWVNVNPLNKPTANKKFSERVADLRAFKDKYGHCTVQQKQDKSLQQWCAKIRREYKTIQEGGNPLTLFPEGIQELEELGFDWIGPSTGNPGMKRNTAPRVVHTETSAMNSSDTTDIDRTAVLHAAVEHIEEKVEI